MKLVVVVDGTLYTDGIAIRVMMPLSHVTVDDGNEYNVVTTGNGVYFTDGEATIVIPNGLYHFQGGSLVFDSPLYNVEMQNQENII